MFSLFNERQKEAADLRRRMQERAAGELESFFVASDTHHADLADAALAELLTNITHYPGRYATRWLDENRPSVREFLTDRSGAATGVRAGVPDPAFGFIFDAFDKARSALEAYPGSATTLLLAVDTPDALELSYTGDGFGIVCPVGHTAFGNLIVPQHGPGARLSSWLSSSAASEEAFLSFPKAQGASGLVALIASDGLALDGNDSSLQAAAQALIRVQRDWPIRAEEGRALLQEAVERPELRADNRTVAVLITSEADADLRSRDRVPGAVRPAVNGPSVFGATSAGPKRSNQDAWAGEVAGEYAFIAVADGVGTTPNASLAAEAAVAAVSDLFVRRFRR